jgi:hypothetical protein
LRAIQENFEEGYAKKKWKGKGMLINFKRAKKKGFN